MGVVIALCAFTAMIGTKKESGLYSTHLEFPKESGKYDQQTLEDWKSSGRLYNKSLRKQTKTGTI